MSTEINKEVVGYFIDQLWNKHNIGVVFLYLDVNYIDHVDNTLGIPPGLPPGPEGFGRLVNYYLVGFPNLRAMIEDLIAVEDKVVARVTWNGTHTEDLMGIPATGKQIKVTGISMSSIGPTSLVDYTILASWGLFDGSGILQQIGAIVPPRLHPPLTPLPVGGPWPSQCHSTADCSPGYVCRDGQCRPR